MEDMSVNKYRKEEQIDIDVAIGVVQLSKKSLAQLNQFVKDYLLYCWGSQRISMFRDKKQLSSEEFISFCRNKLKLCANNYSTEFEERCYYRSLLNNYKGLLKELMSKSDEFLNKFFEAIRVNSSLYRLFNYLLDNYDDKDINLQNLMRVKELGISNFVFDENTELDGSYTIVVLENREMSKKGKKVYGIQGFACDGVKEWDIQTDVDGYTFDAKEVNYVISYIKGTAFRDSVNMVIKRLDFDVASLPSKEELDDISVVPNIDFDLIRKKTRAVNLTYAHERSLKAAEELLKHSQDLIFNLEYGGFNQKALEMKKQLIFLEAFIANAESMSGTLASEYVESGVIKNSELHELVAKKRERDKEKEKRFYKKK